MSNKTREFMRSSNNVFFKPTESWWKLVKETPWLRWNEFVDVGAGMGRLTRLMRENGLDCRAVDLHERENAEVEVEVRDARSLTIHFGQCAVVARPCHDDWFRELLRDTTQNYATALYVGLEQNVDFDLEDFHVRLLAENVGEDGEHCWRVIGHKRDVVKHALIQLEETWSKPYWMLDDGRWYHNSAGGGFPKDGVRVKVHAEGMLISSDQEFDSTDACDTDSQVGWILPDGTFMGGPPASHSGMLHNMLGIPEARAEKLGFVRCYGETSGRMFWVCGGGAFHEPEQKPTKKQWEVLRSKGYTRDDEEWERSHE